MNSTAGLSFKILNFPVRVHISFFLVAILLGWSNDVIRLVLWVLIVLFSILLHELGHAIAAEYYGREPRIELYSMGGLTIYTRNSLLSYPKEILISFAGPLAGFLLGGLLYVLLRFVAPINIIENPYLNYFFAQLLWVNIGWGIINLIPILPLDGGQIMLNLYHWLRNPYDNRTPYIISIVFGVIGIVFALVFMGRNGIFLALLAGWLTFNNFMALRQGYWSDTFI
jgi:membrane-associated protease RseP (regulator of RpoE activity)